MEEVGVKSTTIVFLVSFLIGVILAFQSAHQLSRLGALEFVGALVGVAILRELGALDDGVGHVWAGWGRVYC